MLHNVVHSCLNTDNLVHLHTVQYENASITHDILVQFLKQHQLNYRSNSYMVMFEFKGHRIVAFKGGRFLIHGMTRTSDATHLMNLLFG
ncbi:hypothetical protein APV44_05055 [Staphylococcus aureus]|nr:hypothetical protein APV44_05055 [Staphylococcus aureus]